MDRGGALEPDELRAENDALRAENERLQRQVEALQQQIAEHVANLTQNEAARRRAEALEAILEEAPPILFVKDLEGRYLFGNRSYRGGFLGDERFQLEGKTDDDIFPRELSDSYRVADQEVAATNRVLEREDEVPLGDGVHHYITTKYLVRGPAGEGVGVCSISVDITTYKRAEEENRRLQEEIIRVQESTLRALSTPLIPIARGVVAMPLIGNVDRARADQVLETLLDGIVAHAAATVILDVTGVPVVDADVASALVKTAKAVRLLGAEVILTGIQPKIAQTIVTLGAELGSVVTEGTLESAITRALRKQDRAQPGTSRLA